jgi:hypothetical protein
MSEQKDELIRKLTTRLYIANRIFNEIGFLIAGKGAPPNCNDILLHRKDEIEKVIKHGLGITHTNAIDKEMKD